MTARRLAAPVSGRNRLIDLLSHLRRTVIGLQWDPDQTEWADYADRTSYSDEATAHKVRLVEALGMRVPGRRKRGTSEQHRPIQPGHRRRWGRR